MITPTRFPRANRALFVIALVCLLTTIASTVFVAARGGASEERSTETATTAAVDASTKAKVAERFGRLPLSFEINEGQVAPSVKFLAHGPGYELFLTSTEAVLSLGKARTADKDPRRLNPSDVGEGSVLRLKMIGANATAHVEGRDELPGKVNYFIGNDPEKWRRNISTFRKVYYRDVYPGIDVVYYGNQRELEYDFVVAPGANPKVIKFHIDGADRIRVDDTGSLLLAVKHGEVRLNKPFIYQVNEKGARTEIKGAYAIQGNEISFKVRGFDSGKPLVIDPVLSYATFLGSSGNEQAFGIAVDSQGSAYVTGVTSFSQFPTTPGSFKPTSTGGGAFVTKLDPTGTSLVYSTYLAGRNASTGNAIAVDSAGNAYVTGHTSSIDFPLVNPLKTGSNFFKTTDSAANWNNINSGLLSESVRTIAVAPSSPNTIHAGLLSGPYRSTDGGATWTKTPTTGLAGSFITTMAVDPANASIVYVAPGTSGNLFRSTNGGDTWTQVNGPVFFQGVNTIVWDPVTPSTMYIGTGAGVFKSTDSGNTWTALNNFSGSVVNPPNVRALAIDPTSPATIYAGTGSSPGLFKTTNGGTSWAPMTNGMVNAISVNTVVIDPFNSQTVYAGSGFISGSQGGINKTTNGGTSWTPLTNGVPTNVPVNVIVIDRTNASILYAATNGGGVIKTTNGGTSWTKVNSGVWKREIHTLVAHPSNPSILFAGGGGDSQIDAFVTKLNSSGSALLFSTFLGGSEAEIGNGIAVDSTGNIYVAGETNSQNFPTANAFQSAPIVNETCNSAFVTKINPATPSFVFSTYLDGSNCDRAFAIALDTGANVYVTGNTASSNFPVANAFQSTKTGFFDTDAYVTKFSTTGSLVYSTYLGGNGGDETGFGIVADAAGNAHVTGTTTAGNFPTLNPIQVTHGGGAGDVFVTKLNSQGSGLLYSTFLGGSETDVGRGIALDSAGNAYVAGFTSSVGFPLVAGSLGTKSGLYKSFDGAANWTNDNYGLKSSVTELAIHPTQPATIYAATDFGVFKSTNGGRNWTPMNNGLNSLFIRAIVIDPVTPSTLYVAANGFSGGPNDGVYKSTDGGNSWNLRKNGLTSAPFSLAINPATPTELYAASSVGPVFKTTDGADNWARSGTGGSSNASSVAVDPKTPTTVFANELFSDGGIWRSTDSGGTWQKVFSSSNGPGAEISISPLTAGLIYAAGGSSVLKSVDNGNNWTQVRTGVGFARITFDPVSSSTVYIGSGIEGVLKSTDNGQTWTAMNTGLRIVSAGRIVIDPLKPSTLYVASSPLGNQSDAFVTKLNPTGSTLIYSTLIGGAPQAGDPLSLNDNAFAIAVDSAGSAYVTGLGRTQLPVSLNSYQPFNRGGDDAFIAKLTMSHIISGQVKDGSNTPITGAEVVLNDGTSIRAITTESDGSYEFSQLREGGNFTVSASKPHFTMTPTSQTFNNLTSNQTLDFTATATTAAFHTISGQITNNGVGLANVTVTLSGSQPGLRTTDSNGNYSFELAAGGNYTVTPSIIGFAFAPLNLTFNNLGANQPANFAATRQNFAVTNANNHGTGSLREAITNANATVGLDTIVFNIPGPGVKLISLLNALPEITDPVVVDGTTQPGYAGTPLIEIDGSLVGTFGTVVVIKAGGSTVRGLALGRSSLGILINNCDNNVIQANHIGVDATGTASRQNGTGIRLTNSSNNVIGGTTAAARNVISGNGTDGIEINGNGNVVQGNYIGTNAAGTAAIPNGSKGVSIPSTPFANNVIGGTVPGAGNLISGNDEGIRTEGTGTTIQGNLIGTNVTGTQIIGNGAGIVARGPNTQIGGLTPAARNIISGNGGGVHSEGAGSKIQGNFIGTDITGTLALGNTHSGIDAANTLIGGTTPEARNIISANGGEQGGLGNIALGFNVFGPGATVQGNYIGTDVTGTKALKGTGPGVHFGITVLSNNHAIGGTDAGAGNVISGNDIGIQLGGFSSPPTGVVIQGNIIGLNAPGTAPVPNLHQGIKISGADNNTIGGIQNGAANKIAFSGLAGVEVNSGAGNSIRGNSIFSNGQLGIDLGFTRGVTANDAGDVDAGSNNLQNFPVVTSVSSTGGNTTIQGSLNSTANTTFHIDFYSNAAVDASGNGEGALFFNTTAVTTDAGGNATINVTFPTALPAGRVITATATSPNGNTSEFSAVDAAGATGSVQFSLPTFVVIEDIGQMTVTVQRVGGSTGTVSVEYATADGTAIAGQDYTATTGTLTFGNGETSKTFQVPIANDAPTEPDETFTVLLRNPSNLEALGMPVTMAVTIQDKTTVPTVFLLTSPAVLEGDSGTTTDARFDVQLSAATGRTISVNYATANVDAHGGAACGVQGVDYESRSATLTFQPGTHSITVLVKVCGDSSAERNEQFGFALSNPVNATIPVQLGDALGTIVNDDVIQLLLEESGPGVNQVAALDSLLFVRDPFGVVTVPELFANGTDRNTRLALFVRNLQLNPGETSSAVVVRLIGSNNQLFDVPAEDFRAVPGTDLMQVTFRLPNNIPAGTAAVTIRSHLRASNIGTLRTAP